MPPTRKEFKKPVKVGQLPVKVDAPVKAESISSQFKFTPKKVTEPTVSAPSLLQSREPKKATSAYTPVVEKLMKEQPLSLTRYQTASTGTSKTAAAAVAKDSDFSRFVRDMRGGIAALTGDDLSTGEKVKAAGMAPVKAVVGLGAGTRDFLTLQVPKAATIGIKMVADNITKNTDIETGEGWQDYMSKITPLTGVSNWVADKVFSTKTAQKFAGKTADVANSLIELIDNKQKERLGELGIDNTTSIINPEKFGYGVSSGLSSIAFYMGVTALTKSPAIASASLGWVEGSETYLKARETYIDEGMNQDKAESKAAALALIESGGIALLEKVGMDALFRSYAGGKMRNAAISAITETLQESTQTVWSNLVAKYGYDKTQSLYADLFDTVITTLPVGFLGGAMRGGTDVDANIDTDLPKPPEIEPEDVKQAAGELTDAVLAEARKFSEMVENPQKVDEVTNALNEDIKEAVDTKGKDVVIEQLANDETLGYTEEEAAAAVEGAITSQVPPDIMTDIKAALERVRAPKATEPQVITEPQGTDGVFENIPEDMLQEAEEAWDDTYGQSYAELEQQVQEINTQLKTAQADEKKALEVQKEALVKQQIEQEQTFIREQQEKVQAKTKEKIKKAVDEVQKSLEPKQNQQFSIKEDKELGFVVTENKDGKNVVVGTFSTEEKAQEYINSIAKTQENGIVEGNEKLPDRDTREPIRQAGDTTRDRDGGEQSTERGSTDQVDRRDVARREDRVGDTSARERSERDVELGIVEVDQKVPSDLLAILDRQSYYTLGFELPENFYEGWDGISLGALVDGFEKLGSAEEIFKEAGSKIYNAGYRRLGSALVTENGVIFNKAPIIPEIDLGTEKVVYTDAGVVSTTRTTPIAEKQNTKIGKVIVDIIKSKEQDLRDESLFLTAQAEGFMPLTIERLPTNELAVSHTFTQNGDLMRDPEVVFLIDKDGQLQAQTIENPPMVLNGIELIGPRPISPRDSFLNLWADNIRSQGFVPKAKKPVKVDPGKVNREQIKKLEADMRAIYLGVGDSDIEGFAKADEVMSQIITELEIAEPGDRIISIDGVISYPSTFPAWIPENARNRDDLNALINMFRDVRGLSYPSKTVETKRREFADAFFDEMDAALKVNTKPLREQILKLYDIDNIITAGQEVSEVGQNSAPRDQEGATSERTSEGYTNEEIENVIKDYTYLTATNRVELTNDRVPTKEQLRVANAWQPAGGREAEGAEGRGLLDEYYTPGEVVEMVRTMLDRAGAFDQYPLTVLEPSVGIGNFLYAVPEGSKITAYEINETSARLTKLNHPTANVVVQPFEELFVDKRGNKKEIDYQYEIVVGNPPYGSHRGVYKGLGEEAKISRYETYFMKRSLDLTVEGGYMAMVVPSSFLRSSMKEPGKEQMAALGELVEAIRLPNGTFATTDIGTDILVFRKSSTKDLTTIDNRVRRMSGDAYFLDQANAGRILGEKTQKTGRFGVEDAVKGDLESAQKAFETVYEPETPIRDAEIVDAPAVTTDDVLTASPEKLEKIASEPSPVQEVAQREQARRIEQKAATDLPAQEEMLKKLDLKTGDKVQRFHQGQTQTGTLTKEEGSSVVQVETESGELVPVDENWYKQDEVAPIASSDTLDLATLSPESVKDGQWEYVSATGELEGNFDPKRAFYMGGKYYNAFNYAQGDIYAKLAQLEKDKKTIDAEQYETQKAMLEAVLPPRMTVDRMRIPPHAHFTEEVKFNVDVAGEKVKKSLQSMFIEWIGKLPVGAFGESSRRSVQQYVFGEAVRGGDKLQNERDRRTRRIEGDKLFKVFLTEELSDAQKKQVEDEYNRRFNSYSKPDYSLVPLVSKISATYKGDKLDLREIQRQGIGFLLNKGVGLLAHDVGLGKTMQGIIANIELINRGWAKRPLVVLPSASVYAQWVKDFRALKPDIKINELSNLGRDFKGDLATLSIPDGTISVITEEGFKKLGFSDATYKELTKDMLDVIENPNDGKKTKRAKELQTAKAEETIGKAMKGTSAERTFEDLGFDAITVDEIHNYNHIIGSAKAADDKATEYRGFSQQPSISGLKLWLAAQFIMQKNNGRNVIGLSATPFTNHPLEYYSILSLFARKRMQEMGIRNVNDFMAMYMDVTAKNEVTADGQIASKLAVRGFNNAQQFQQLLREFIDFRDGEEAGIKRPNRQSRTFVVKENRLSYDYKQMAQPLFEIKEGGTLMAMTELQQIAFSPYASQFHTGPLPTPKQFVEGSPKVKLATDLLAETYFNVPSSNHIVYSHTGKDFLPMIKEYLVKEKGIPADQIQIITGDTAKPKRTTIQNDFNAGKVRIIIGNVAIEEGINLQERTTDMYLLSQPWNFTAVRQVIGRAWRQGNKWNDVRINQFFTENTFDIYMSQALEKKRVRYEQSLKQGEDYVDSGDVDYDEMKFALMTDPVLRTRQMFSEKRQLMEQEIKRIKSDFATRNRRAKEYVDAVAKVNEYKAYIVKYPDANWAKSNLRGAEEKLVQVKQNLTERGIDVASLDKDLLAMEAMIAEKEDQLKNFATDEAEAIEKAKIEAETQVDTSGTEDYAARIKERKEDDQTIFIPQNPQFAVKRADIRTRRPQPRTRDGKYTTLAERRAEARSLGYVADTNLDRIEDAKVYGRRADKVYAMRAKAISYEDAKAQLEMYMKRFNIKFDVDLADRIFTQGSKVRDKILAESEAYAVYYNRAITLTPEMLKTTAQHEFIHLVVDNLSKIKAFEGYTKEGLYIAVNKGKSISGYNSVQLRALEEKLAVGFERYLIEKALDRQAREKKYGKPLADFYEKLKNMVVDLVRNLGGSFGVIADFYDTVARSQTRNEETLVLMQNPVRKAQVAYQTDEGLKYLDFEELNVSLEEVKSAARAAYFSKVLEIEDDEMMTNKVFQNKNKLNFVKKDLNTLEDMTAQARDIYLKDPEQFEQANNIELIGEAHDADKHQLDNTFADLLKPYMDLKPEQRARVNEILWKGDEEGKRFDQGTLIRMSLSAEQITAYNAVRDALDAAHETLLTEMARKGIDEAELDTFRQEREGYMPHRWIPKMTTGQKLKSFVTGKDVFVVKHQRKSSEGGWETYHMDAFASEKEAEEAQIKFREETPKEFLTEETPARWVVDKLSSLEVDFFSSQELTSERMIAVIEQMREKKFVKDEIVELLKNNVMNMFKEKGFGRHYLRRSGVRGYDTDNTELVIADYFSGFAGYVTKLRWSTEYFVALSQVDARRQQRYYAWLRDLIAYKLNNNPEWRMARTIAFTWYLANDLSYLLTNMTQNVIVGLGELSKYVEGADKAWKPEAYMIKAVKDWATKNITAEEAAAISGLLEKGQLGAEMTVELMGFKNNPLYREISSTFSKVMYGSTAIVEREVNRIPAFLAARRIFREQGFSETTANAKALEVSNDIHFRYGRIDRPRLFRGRVNVLFIFQNYIRTFLYQLYRDASRREFIALTRKMGYTFALGGASALPFAGLFWSILKGIGDDEEDEELKKELSTWDILIQRGIPATWDIDLSTRVGIELLSVTKIADNPTDVRTYLGSLGDLLFKRPVEVMDLIGQQRYMDAWAKALPDVLANPIRAYNGYTYGVRSINGVPLLDVDGEVYKYNTWEAIIKAIGFTPTQEAILWDEKAKEWKKDEEQQEKRTEISRTIRGMVQRGEFEEARQLQDDAKEAGIIAERTDYIRTFAKDEWFQEAVKAWETGNKTREELDAIEEELIEKVYGGVATDDQRNNVRKELAIYRQFGLKNENVNDIMKAATNADKVKILLEIKDNIGQEAFDTFIQNGRTGIYTEAGNRVPILFSDDLMKLLREEERKYDNQN